VSRAYEPDAFEHRPDSPLRLAANTERRPESDSPDGCAHGANSGAGHSQELERDIGPPQTRSTEPRTPYRDQRWTYSLRTSEIQTLRELGTFRAVDSEALAEIGYGGNRNRLEQDLRNLIRQSLITRRAIEGPESKRMHVLSLTKAGQRLLRNYKLMPKDRPIYYGLVKPKEAQHDATLYRLYQRAAHRIHRDGGNVRKVALDYELKKQINKELARLGTERHNPEKKNEIALAHGVRVVNGRVAVPDLQVEYENGEGQLARVNLELATKHYRPAQLQAKAQAGFSLYAPSQDADHLRRVLSDREITAEILSL